MSTVKSFSVGAMTVNAAMPSAVEQDEALFLIGSDILERAVTLHQMNQKAGERMLTYMFTSNKSFTYHTKQRVASILLSKVMIAGTSTPVSVNDFQGKMQQYNELLAKLALWNYDDFFTSLHDALNEDSPNTQAPAQ